jgi:hypothetical protein
VWDVPVYALRYTAEAHQEVSPLACAQPVSTHADQAASSDPGILLVGGCFLVIAALGAWLYTRHHRPDDAGGDGGSGGRGGPGGPPPEPHPPDSPTWWPEFEREFAAHVAGKHENEKRPVPVGPSASPD